MDPEPHMKPGYFLTFRVGLFPLFLPFLLTFGH